MTEKDIKIELERRKDLHLVCIGPFSDSSWNQDSPEKLPT